MEEIIIIQINIKHDGSSPIGNEILIKTIEALKEYDPVYHTDHKIVLRPINNPH